MTDKELNKFGEWLNTKGYDIDLNDDFWMEDYRWHEHKTRDIIDLINDYHTEQLILPVVSKCNDLGNAKPMSETILLLERKGLYDVYKGGKRLLTGGTVEQLNELNLI